MRMKEKMPITSTTPVPTPSAAIAAEAHEQEVIHRDDLQPEPTPTLAPVPTGGDVWVEPDTGRDEKRRKNPQENFFDDAHLLLTPVV